MSFFAACLSAKRPSEPLGRVIRDSMVEFVATTLFVFSGTMSAVSTSNSKAGEDGGNVAQILPIAMSFGISILALAHSIGHLTGGHMNPGVSFLMFLKGQLSVVKMGLYWVAQMAGGFAGSILVYICTSGLTDNLEAAGEPPFNLGSTTLAHDRLTVWNGFFLELIGSTVFYFVISQTALDKRGIATTAFPAIPIGLILVVVHVCLIPFTGCGVNPARTFGPSAVTCLLTDKETCEVVIDGEWYWIYYAGPFLAAVIVAEITTWMSLEFGETAQQEVVESPRESTKSQEPDLALHQTVTAVESHEESI